MVKNRRTNCENIINRKGISGELSILPAIQRRTRCIHFQGEVAFMVHIKLTSQRKLESQRFSEGLWQLTCELDCVIVSGPTSTQWIRQTTIHCKMTRARYKMNIRKNDWVFTLMP